MKTDKQELVNNVHGIDKTLSREKEKLKKEFLLPANRKLVEDYLQWKVDSDSVGQYQQVKIISKLRKLCGDARKPLDQYTTADWRGVNQKLLSEPYKQNTIRTHQEVLKNFVRWLYDKSGIKTSRDDRWYPDCIAWLKYKKDEAEPLDFEKLLHWDDVLKLCHVVLNQRDTAFVQTLWDSGARIGELLMLSYGDVIQSNGVVSLAINQGKTVSLGGKPRKVSLLPSIPALRNYLKFHPLANRKKLDKKGFPEINEDAPLWVEMDGEPRPLDAKSARSMLERLKKRSGLKKKINPHWFRKSSASYYAKILSHAEFCYRYGWALNSDAPSRYITTDEEAMNKKIRQAFGIEPITEEEKTKIVVRYCSECGEINDESRYLCVVCGGVLESAETMVAKKLDEKLVGLNQEFLEEENEDYQERFFKFCQKKGFNLDKFKEDLLKNAGKM